ncbi:MAG: hypothetical protein NTY83_04285 [Candidatus Micrarchaeota archaeon]|nr:hypothetical protein [Candidatus Micrarchaeota archaeon]
MAGPYGKPLFFSKLQMIPVKEEKPPEDLGQKPESGSRELDGGNPQISASYRRSDTEAGSHKRKIK